MQDWADELRKKDGVEALMKIMLEIAKANPAKHFMFDSLRNHGEADFLRQNSENFILIAVDAPKEIRFQRIISRGKLHDPKTWEDFLVVDNRDLNDEFNPHGQHTQKLIDMADFVIVNDQDLESGKKKVEEIWNKIMVK